MTTYRVLRPIAVTVGQGENAAVKHYSRPGTVVELDDKTAAPLVEAGRIEMVEEASSRKR
ncbi:hypothetical protein [Mycobacterium sp. ZZG]